jgi:uncharacterized protein
MRTHAALPAIGLLLFASAATVAAQPAPTPEPPALVTRGETTLKRAPDQAWVSIAAEARAPKSADAQRRAADAMTSLQAALKAAGIPADAIKTTNYSLQPDIAWVNGASQLKGYIAHNQIEVRVDALDKISAVLDAAGGSGNAASISGLRFDLKDRSTVEREALRLAVRDAMTRAEAMAAGAGRSLGQIIRIEEQTAPPIVVQTGVMRMAAAEKAEQTPITPGEIEIRASVTLTVAIR